MSPLFDRAKTEAFLRKRFADEDAKRAQDEYTRLRKSHDRLLAAAKMAFCMIDRKYEATPPYEALIAAIAAAEEQAP